MNETTLDAVLGGRIRLHQPRKGHRVGADTVLLAMSLRSSGHVLDLGCGVGGVGLIFASVNPAARVTLVDRDPEMLALARRNIVENGLQERVDIVEADIFAPEPIRRAAGLGRACADLILSNPPFARPGAGRVSPTPARRSAHVLEGGGLNDWLRTAASCAKPGASTAIIHRADALDLMLQAMQGRFGGVAIRFVQSSASQPAIRLLASGTKGNRKPLSVLPPIDLASRDWRLVEQGEGASLLPGLQT